jgi:hypothetical protein
MKGQALVEVREPFWEVRKLEFGGCSWADFGVVVQGSKGKEQAAALDETE